MNKIHCPFHSDNTASLHLYRDGFKCFGCGKHGRLNELPANVSFDSSLLVAAPKVVENIAESIARIRALPLRTVRGLSLPCDESSYYVVWPDGDYYNRRFFDINGVRGKYKCPSGHAKRLFVAHAGNDLGALAIVEGELNALSVAEACPGLTVVSPGGAGDFYSKHAINNYLRDYARFKTVHLFADEDTAGAIACIELKARLIPLNPSVFIHLMKRDANDILVQNGKEALKEAIYKAMEMPGGVQADQGAVQAPGEGATKHGRRA